MSDTDPAPPEGTDQVLDPEPLPKRTRRTGLARSRSDLVAIDQARAAAGVPFSPAYQAWLDSHQART
jgi:hypothetical protein